MAGDVLGDGEDVEPAVVAVLLLWRFGLLYSCCGEEKRKK